MHKKPIIATHVISELIAQHGVETVMDGTFLADHLTNQDVVDQIKFSKALIGNTHPYLLCECISDTDRSDIIESMIGNEQTNYYLEARWGHTSSSIYSDCGSDDVVTYATDKYFIIDPVKDKDDTLEALSKDVINIMMSEPSISLNINSVVHRKVISVLQAAKRF